MKLPICGKFFGTVFIQRKSEKVKEERLVMDLFIFFFENRLTFKLRSTVFFFFFFSSFRSIYIYTAPRNAPSHPKSFSCVSQVRGCGNESLEGFSISTLIFSSLGLILDAALGNPVKLYHLVARVSARGRAACLCSCMGATARLQGLLSACNIHAVRETICSCGLCCLLLFAEVLH